MELGHTHSFPCQLWLLWLQEKSNCDGCNHKAKSIYHLYRKQPNKLMSLIVGTYSQGHSRVTGVGQGEVSVGIWCSAKCSPNQSFHYHQSPLDTVQIRILSPWGILVHNLLAPICTIHPLWHISLTKYFLIFSQHLDSLVPTSYICEGQIMMAPGTSHIFLVLCVLVNHKHLVELGWGQSHILILFGKAAAALLIAEAQQRCPLN